IPLGADARFYLRYDAESDLTDEELRRLRSARIYLVTTFSAGKAFRQANRPLLIFDEISQVSMGRYLGLLASAKGGGRDIDRIALVGDPAQLPVVTTQGVLEPNAASYLLAEVAGLRPHELLLQYRMHPTICSVVNRAREALGAFPLETAA